MKALITGASNGIGEKIAYELSSRNYDLILVSQNIQKMKKVADNCKTEVDIIECDLRKKENVIKLYEKIKNENIEVFVNNAGFGLFGEFWETDLDRELEMIDVNIKAVHILTKLILTKFMKQNRGYILNVASSAGFMAGPKLSTYYATKNYVLRLSEAIYEELHRQKSNVKICVLCPGPVNTNFNKTAGGKFNIKGRVCLLNSTLFGLMGMLASHFVHPLLMKLVTWIKEPLVTYIAMGLAAVLSVDFIFTVRKLINFSTYLAKLEEFNETLKSHFINEAWFNNSMSFEEMLHKLKIQTKQKSDEVTAAIMQRIESFTNTQKKTISFINNFPTMTSKRYKSQLEQLRETLRKNLSNRKKH